MKKNGFVTFLLSGIMAASSVIPAWAENLYGVNLEQYYEEGTTEIHTTYAHGIEQDARVASGIKYETCNWNWINGYCYYFTMPGKDYHYKLMNCTTPDGYTVDEEGRWTVNGVAQYNGYGNQQVETDALYAGLDDDARWLVMRGYLEKMIAEKQTSGTDQVSMTSYDDAIHLCAPRSQGTILHNDGNGDYIYFHTGNYWCDSPEHYENNYVEMRELIIKAICGDHAGQELFDAIRKAAEPAEGGGYNQIIFDESGNPIPDDERTKNDPNGFTYVKVQHYDTSGDGINFNYIDMAKWGSGQMKTDYGKSIYLTAGYEICDDYATKTPIDWYIVIK